MKIKAKGVVIKYGDSAAPTTTIPQLAEVSMDLGQWDRENITTHDTSGKTKEYDTTLKEPAGIDVNLLLDPADTAHAWLIAAHAAGTLKYLTLVFPDAGAATWDFSGHVMNLNVPGLTPEGFIRASFTFMANSAHTFTA